MANDDQKYYDIVADELAKKVIKPGLWARALAETGTDNAEARARYISLRVSELKKEPRSGSISEDLQNKPLGMKPKGNKWQVNRLEYCALILAEGLLVKMVERFDETTGLSEVVSFSFLLFIVLGYLAVMALRVRSIGWSGWWSLLILTPFLLWGIHLVVPWTPLLIIAPALYVGSAYVLIALPPQYAQSKKADTAMRVWSWIYGILALLFIVLLILLS